MIHLSDERPLTEEFMEEASIYLANLALSNLAFFGIMADGTTRLSTIPEPPCLPDTLDSTQLDSVHVGPDDKPSKGVVTEPAIAIYEDRRRHYKCGHCGKLHDRKSRAEDCRNVDLGIKPYKCLGKCGKKSWFVCPYPCPLRS
jgi:hypothetical protein